MKKINSGAISARTCKSIGLCTESAGEEVSPAPVTASKAVKTNQRSQGLGYRNHFLLVRKRYCYITLKNLIRG